MAVVCIGTGILVILSYHRDPSQEKLIVTAGIVSLGGSWLGGVGSFISILFTSVPLEYIPHLYLQAWAPFTAVTLWTFLTFKLVKPDWTIRATAFMLILLVIYLFLRYVLLPLVPSEINGNIITIPNLYRYRTIEGNLPHTTYLGIPLILVFIAIITAVFFIEPAFLWFAGLKADDATVIAKGRLIGVGIILFGIFQFLMLY